MTNSGTQKGRIVRISGPVVDIEGLTRSQLYELVHVGEEGLMGEIIRIVIKGSRHIATTQVYEETAGLTPGDPAEATTRPLSVELGPGLIGQIYDGIQRPLPTIKDLTGDFIKRGISAEALDHSMEYEFTPLVAVGDQISGGSIIGQVEESPVVKGKILVPPRLKELKITEIIPQGSYNIDKTIVKVKNVSGNEISLKMFHTWPVRQQRPFKEKLATNIPLVTGQRIYDTFFPIPKGGTGAIPGGFGTGKCVVGNTPVLHSNGELIQIKKIYEQHLHEGGIILEDSEDETLVKLKDPIQVLSFDGVGYSPRFATHIYRGKTNEIIQVKTRTGRKVKVTPIHKLFRFNGETVEEVEARDLRVGDHLIVPRKLNITGEIINFDPYEIDLNLRAVDPQTIQEMLRLIYILKERMTLKELAKHLDVSYDVLIGYWKEKNKPTLSFLNHLAKFAGVPRIPVELVKSERQSEPFRIPRCLTKELCEWLGLFVADGHIKGKRGNIFLYNNSEQILNRFKEISEDIFDVRVEFGQDSPERTPNVCIPNKTLRKFLYYLGIPKIKKTYKIRIPSCIRQASEDYLVYFLIGYFTGDGSFSRYTIQFDTASYKLHSDLGYLLTRLGILYQARIKLESHIIEINGVEAEKLANIFISHGVFPYTKVNSLYEYATKNTRHFIGIDVVPIAQQLLIKLENQGKDYKGHNVFRKGDGIRLTNYTQKGENITKNMLYRIMDVIDIQKPKIEPEVQEKLNYIKNLTDEVYFDRITELMNSEEDISVYDLTIDGTHNFVGGILPFTLHNTVSQHQLAKWSDATVVVYIGCGERGNEMTEVLEEFPNLEDPRTGEKLMKRTVLIANTSNMPVAAREASIYTGITLAEYYRDQGFDVALMADSTSRWAEALREISGRLEEMPSEEGYPAYLGSKVAEFYERAGRVVTLSGEKASISAVGAVSPPGGDFSEPVTQSTLRTVRVFWALSKRLASARHFPAIDWLGSYSLYADDLSSWFAKNVSSRWEEDRQKALAVLQEEKRLQEIVQLVGPDALPETDKATLQIARMLREDLLQQHAYSEEDSYCDLEKQAKILEAIMRFGAQLRALQQQGVPVATIIRHPVLPMIARMKWLNKKPFEDNYQEICTQITQLPSEYSEHIAASS